MTIYSVQHMNRLTRAYTAQDADTRLRTTLAAGTADEVARTAGYLLAR